MKAERKQKEAKVRKKCVNNPSQAIPFVSLSTFIPSRNCRAQHAASSAYHAASTAQHAANTQCWERKRTRERRHRSSQREREQRERAVCSFSKFEFRICCRLPAAVIVVVVILHAAKRKKENSNKKSKNTRWGALEKRTARHWPWSTANCGMLLPLLLLLLLPIRHSRALALPAVSLWPDGGICLARLAKKQLRLIISYAPAMCLCVLSCLCRTH